MEIGERQKLEELGEDLVLWANRAKEERIKHAKAVYELGLLLATGEIPDRLSFENKVLQLLRGGGENHKQLWHDYTISRAKYKSAELIHKSIESKINSIKFINRSVL